MSKPILSPRQHRIYGQRLREQTEAMGIELPGFDLSEEGLSAEDLIPVNVFLDARFAVGIRRYLDKNFPVNNDYYEERPRCFVCGSRESSIEQHHRVARCVSKEYGYGPINYPINIVPLCQWCHETSFKTVVNMLRFYAPKKQCEQMIPYLMFLWIWCYPDIYYTDRLFNTEEKSQRKEYLLELMAKIDAMALDELARTSSDPKVIELFKEKLEEWGKDEKGGYKMTAHEQLTAAKGITKRLNENNDWDADRIIREEVHKAVLKSSANTSSDEENPFGEATPKHFSKEEGVPYSVGKVLYQMDTFLKQHTQEYSNAEEVLSRNREYLKPDVPLYPFHGGVAEGQLVCIDHLQDITLRCLGRLVRVAYQMNVAEEIVQEITTLAFHHDEEKNLKDRPFFMRLCELLRK